jgi:LysR family transcriptional regulator, low CO2-responsive transcriptional regulator
LEQEYGDRLLDRSGKTVKLTPAGQVLYDYAVRLTQLREESVMAVADHSRTPRGTLRVGANEATCLYVLPEVFAEYCRRYPPVQINIYRNFSYKVTEKLENGSIEVGFLTLPIQSPSLEIQTIFRDKLMLMVSPRNPLAKQKTASVSEIVKHPLLLPKTGHTRRLLDKLFRPHRNELQVRMELPSIGMIKSFVAADIGVSIISASFARDEVASGAVKLVDLEDVELFRELGLAFRRDRTLSCASTAFIEVLRQLAASPKKKGAPPQA